MYWGEEETATNEWCKGSEDCWSWLNSERTVDRTSRVDGLIQVVQTSTLRHAWKSDNTQRSTYIPGRAGGELRRPSDDSVRMSADVYGDSRDISRRLTLTSITKLRIVHDCRKHFLCIVFDSNTGMSYVEQVPESFHSHAVLLTPSLSTY